MMTTTGKEREAARGGEDELAVCTIVAKNYLGMARVVCESFLRHHPEARAFVLLADVVDGRFDPAKEVFTVIEARELGIPDFEDFAFKYDVTEFSTAVKPYFLQHLLEKQGVSRLVYLDPDIKVYSRMTELLDALREHDAVLTPHVCSPIREDGRRPQETEILMAGVFNLGFVAFRNTPDVTAFLDWWQSRLYDRCYSDPARGLFTDQKWMNLAPCFLEKALVLRHRGYNVAYWNLQERLSLTKEGDGWTVRGVPLRFFHFSGFDRRSPNRVSKHQDRFRLPDLPLEYRRLFEDYSRSLEGAGWDEASRWPCHYSTFDDGTSVLGWMRRTYADLGDERRRFGNPYRVEGERSFLAWLAAPHTPGSPLSNLALTLYRARPDVVHAYPDVKGTHQEAFLEWMVDHSREDFGLGENLFEPIRAALRALRAGQALAPSEEAAPARPASESLSISGGPGGGPPFGINLVGYFDTESGVGEIARSVARMVEASGIPHVLVNLEQPWLRRGDRTFTSFSTAAPYAVNVVLVNADQTPAVFDRLGLRRAPGTYNVGYWFWELSRFPARFSPAFEWVDEVWVASDFCLDAISRETRRPVVKIRPAFEPVAPGRKRRRQFALSESEFVFLYVFDAASVLKRKNPAGAIRAFRRAFRPEANARLLLKTTGAPPKTLAALERLSGDARVSIWNDYLDRGDLLDLVAASDAYVSPHRSEGFGLTLLEALLMGKPAVATNYGGVREFIDLPNVRSIKCREVFLAQDAGPYPAGSAWAEPDVEDAAAMMREVLEAGTGPSAAARATVAEIRRRFGLPSTTAALVQRLGLIRSWIERGPS